MIFLENPDELFELQTPAGMFSSPWALSNERSNNRRPIHNPYGKLGHGEKILSSTVKLGLTPGRDKVGFVMWGSLVLLTPSVDMYRYMRSFINKTGYPYGWPSCVSGQDEQLITEIYLDKVEYYTNIHQRYCWIPGKDDWLDGEKAVAYHYLGVKPWLDIYYTNNCTNESNNASTNNCTNESNNEPVNGIDQVLTHAESDKRWHDYEAWWDIFIPYYITSDRVGPLTEIIVEHARQSTTRNSEMNAT
jgi:hypothetical protein